MELFSIQCTTCNARLKVRDAAAIGHILACPKCGGMVQVAPPAGWTPPDPAATVAAAPVGAPLYTGPTAPANAATTESVSGFTIKIPAEQIAALNAARQNAARQGANQSAAAPAAPRMAAATASVQAPSTSPPAGQVNPNDFPPLPPGESGPSIASRLWSGIARNWVLCVCSPAVVLVIALFAWIVFHPVPSTVQAPDNAVAADQVVASDQGTATALENGVAAAPAALPSEDDDIVRGLHATPPPTAAPAAADVAEQEARLPADQSPEAPAAANVEPAGSEPGTSVAAAEANPPVADAASAGPAELTARANPDNARLPAEAVVPAIPQRVPGEPAIAADAKAREPEAPITQDLLPQVAVDARLADPLPGLAFKRIALADFCDFLSKLSTVPITLDVDALSLMGVHPSDLLTVQSQDGTVGETLADALAKRGLVHVVQGHQVIVTTLDRKTEGLAIVRYDVHDLAAGPERAAALAALVPRFVAPLSWQERGGKAQINAADELLVVNQTPFAQRQVTIFFDRLRQSRGLAVAEHLRPDESSLKTRYSRARANLDKVVTANFAMESPLTEILAWLSRATGTRLLIDEASLAEAGLWSGWPATLVADHQPLHEALVALLSPQGMTFRVVDERTLQIFACRSLPSRFECEMYPVGDLLGAGITPDVLVNKLCDRIGADNWSGKTGPAAIELDAEGQHLLVMQGPEVQIRVEGLLEKAKAGVQAAR